MSSTNERVVQTTLEETEYERFRRVAEEEGISLKDALRRAARSYADEKERINEDDPLFTVIEELDTDIGDRTSAREMDEDLYGKPPEK